MIYLRLEEKPIAPPLFSVESGLTSNIYDLKMNRKTTNLWLAATSFLVLSISTLWAETREWTSVDGKKLNAEFMGKSGVGDRTHVKLKLSTGKIVEYPLSKLHEIDRVYVEKTLPTDPAALVEEIDKLVINQMKEAYYTLQKEIKELASDSKYSEEVKAKRKAEIEREMQMCIPNPPANDEQFMRRIYLDIAGRIPTYEEAARFLDSANPKKRSALIDELLETDAYAMRMFNFFSDTFRVREGVLPMGGGNIKADPYIEWIKKCMKENTPYDKMVRAMLSDEGRIWDNPATGYMLSDAGMRLCNVSNTFTIFLGTEITCAQCHDHPFEQVKQIDFYRMASFIGTTETNGTTEGNGINSADVARLSKILKDGGKLGETEQTDGQLNDMVGVKAINVNDTKNQQVALPHDYKYDNGEPLQQVKPGAYFGDSVNLEKFAKPREAFADWLTSKGNPRFTVNIVNRLWKLAFGLGQIEPVYNIPGHLDGQAQNYELLAFLEHLMHSVDFKIKDFLRVIYNTNAYQREAETLTPTLTQIDNGTYHFPGPVLRRMTAEQLWDSLVTLTTAKPEGIVRRGWDNYREVMNADTTELKSVEDIEKYKQKYNSVGILSDGESMMMAGEEAARVGGERMVRASEMAQPQEPSHFLRIFGQSDKILIDNQYTFGTTPQVMSLLNGHITNQVLTDPQAYLVKDIVYGNGRKGDKVDKIFLSILGRMPTKDEARAASVGMRPKKDSDMPEADRDALELRAISNVIWSLINTREFMFVQ